MRFKKSDSSKINVKQLLHLKQHKSEFELNKTINNSEINFAVNNWQLCDLIADNKSRDCFENISFCELACFLWN